MDQAIVYALWTFIIGAWLFGAALGVFIVVALVQTVRDRRELEAERRRIEQANEEALGDDERLQTTACGGARRVGERDGTLGGAA